MDGVGISAAGFIGLNVKGSKFEKHQQAAEKILGCKKKINKTHSYRRVHEYLLTKDIKLNSKIVLHLMNKCNLLAEIRHRRKYRVMSLQLHRYPNLLNINFGVTYLNGKLASDKSYMFTRQGEMRLSIIRGLYDNSIVAYKTWTEQTVNLVLNTIKSVIKKERGTRQL